MWSKGGGRDSGSGVRPGVGCDWDHQGQSLHPPVQGIPSHSPSQGRREIPPLFPVTSPTRGHPDLNPLTGRSVGVYSVPFVNPKT